MAEAAGHQEETRPDRVIRYAQPDISDADRAAVSKVLMSPDLTKGHWVEEFEEKVSEVAGMKYAIAVNSCSTALYLMYRAYGIGGKVVSVPPITYVATVLMIREAGGYIAYTDIDPETGLYAATEMESDVSVGVSYRGLEASGTTLTDDAHSFGTTYTSTPIARSFSYGAIKNITTLGEGGAVTTDDENIAKTVRTLRSGWFNFRMSEAQAACGVSQMTRLGERKQFKLDLARKYNKAFEGILKTPEIDPACHYHLYVVRTAHRSSLMDFLKQRGIQSQINYAEAHHGAVSTPHAHLWASECLSLPFHTALSEEDIERVIEGVQEWSEKYSDSSES